MNLLFVCLLVGLFFLLIEATATSSHRHQRQKDQFSLAFCCESLTRCAIHDKPYIKSADVRRFVRIPLDSIKQNNQKFVHTMYLQPLYLQVFCVFFF